MTHGEVEATPRMGLPWTWTKPRDLALADIISAAGSQPLHAKAGQHDELWVRAIRVSSPPRIVYEWVTQLRRAPYSYDLLDNFGRKSPERLDPEAVGIRPGDTVMTIFSTVSVDPGRSFTVELVEAKWIAVCGSLSVTYSVTSVGTETLLTAILTVPLASGPLARIRRYLLAWGDYLMMRKQLLTLGKLAERDSVAR